MLVYSPAFQALAEIPEVSLSDLLLRLLKWLFEKIRVFKAGKEAKYIARFRRMLDSVGRIVVL